MKISSYMSVMICFMAMTFSGVSQSSDSPAVISLILDMDVPTSPTNDQIQEARSSFIEMINELSPEPRTYNYTVVLVHDVSLADRLFFASIGLGSNTELAMSGNNSNEKLSAKSFAEQKAILDGSKKTVESTKVCGTNEIIVRGFMPQSFDQNEDTYKVLDEMGIQYNMGYQEGILYAPGHENDVWPYKVDNHKFYALPISTVVLSGEKVALDDRYINDKGISADQWYDMLTGKLDEISGKDEPMVVSLRTSISGKGDYLDAFKKFIKYAESKDAKFVTAHGLLEMKGIAPASKASECKECESNAHATSTASNTTIVM